MNLCHNRNDKFLSSELSKAGFIEVNQRSKQLLLHHVHKIYHTRSNHYIRSNFDLFTDLHDYDTRNSRFNFYLPESVGSIRNSFLKHWNSLPNGIKEVENYAHFKRKLKEYLYLRVREEKRMTCYMIEFVFFYRFILFTFCIYAYTVKK